LQLNFSVTRCEIHFLLPVVTRVQQQQRRTVHITVYAQNKKSADVRNAIKIYNSSGIL